MKGNSAHEHFVSGTYAAQFACFLDGQITNFDTSDTSRLSDMIMICMFTSVPIPVCTSEVACAHSGESCCDSLPSRFSTLRGGGGWGATSRMKKNTHFTFKMEIIQGLKVISRIFEFIIHS